MDENEVFEKWQAASGEEKERLLEELVRLLQRHAYAITWLKLSEQRADIVDECVWRAISRAAEFKGKSKFSTWFQAMVTNMCNSALRKKLRDKHIVSIEDLSEREQERLSCESEPDFRLDMDRLLNGLSDEDINLVDMEYKGMTASEIAGVLRTTATNVDHRWREVKKKIARNRRRVRAVARRRRKSYEHNAGSKRGSDTGGASSD